MIVHGTNKVSLFNIQSEFDSDLKALLAEEQPEFKCDNLPDWWTRLDKTKRKELSFAHADISIPPIPDAEDFFAFPFRHLSETVVGANSFKATDFANKKGLLSKAAPLLSSRPAYLNHWIAAGEEIGFLGEATYRRKYTNSLGQEVPGGIEAPFILDAVLNGDLVRKMNSPVSPIDSASVTVLFNWVASHEFEDERDFFWHLGEVIDDEMVRRNVEEVVQFEESSLVWAGADPYAKMLDENNQVVNIDQAGVFAKNKFSNIEELTERDWVKKYYVFDCLDESKWLHLSKSVEKFSKTNETHTMKKEFLISLATFLGTTVEALENGQFSNKDLLKYQLITSEAYEKVKTDADGFEAEKKAKEEAEKTVSDNKEKVESYDLALPVITKATGKEDFDAGIKEVLKLSEFKAENEAFATQGKASFEDLKGLAKKTYSAFAQGKPDEAIEKELEEITDPVKLESYIKMWGGKLATHFSAKCTKCNSSENITFQSSKPNGLNNENDKKELPHLAQSLRH